MNCTNCNNPIPEESLFCPHCGHTTAPKQEVDLHPFLKRALIFLEEGDSGKADDYCEKLLDEDPENAYAYVIKLMIRVQVKQEEELACATVSFRDWNSYQSAIRYADDELKAKLVGYLEAAETAIEEKIQANKLIENNRIYQDARQHEQDNASIGDLEKAITLYSKIPGHMDATGRLDACKKRLTILREEQTKQQLEAYRKKKRSTRIRVTIVLVVIAALITASCIFVSVLNAQKEEENARREKEIYAKLQGKTFSGAYSRSFYKYDLSYRYVVTYRFQSSGSVEIDTVRYEYPQIIYNGNSEWKSVKDYSETASSYRVWISDDDEITVDIDNDYFQLEVSSDDTPLALVDNDVTYKRQ